MATRNVTMNGSFALRGGMLIGLAITAASVAGMVVLDSYRSRLGSLPAGAEAGLVSYAFMDHHITALSMTWIGLCVVPPSLYLARRRRWRRLSGVALVTVPSLLMLLGFVIYVTVLGNGLRAVTG